MGKANGKYPYTRVRGKNIQINFRYNGEIFQPFMNLEPTPKNLQKASDIAFDIRQKIKVNQFVMADYFPKLAPVVTVPDFQTIARQWLASRDDISERSLSDYKKILNAHWMPHLFDTPIDQIKFGQLSEILVSNKFKTAKTRNGSITPLRGVFQLAVADIWIESSPAAHLKFKKVQRKHPDPFSIDEIFVILGSIKIKEWLNYYRYQFFSGQRPQETIALQWTDIDFNSGFVGVDKVKSMGKLRGHTKTYQSRKVPINSQMLTALKAQKQFTYMKSDFVFSNPVTGKPIHDEQAPWLFWQGVLKKCGVKYRKPYQTRSSSICMQIMAGENVYKIAKDHGHSLETLLKYYANWIDQVEIKESKLDQYLKELEK